MKLGVSSSKQKKLRLQLFLLKQKKAANDRPVIILRIYFKSRIFASGRPVNSAISSIGLFFASMFFAISSDFFIAPVYSATARSKSLISTCIRYLELKLHNFTSFCKTLNTGSFASRLGAPLLTP